MTEEFQERQVAFKVKINEIESGKYHTAEGWNPNYLLTNSNQKISRANLIGIVVNKEMNGAMVNLVLDDGTGRIKLRSFEEIKNLNLIEIGETILVIGKIRVYQEEKYISPEIVKKIDQEWLKVRSQKLEKTPETIEEKTEPISTKVKNIPTEEIKIEEEFETDNKKIIELIKNLDSGNGALIEEIKEKAEINNIDEIIDKMLKEGEIFQNLPGKVKVL